MLARADHGGPRLRPKIVVLEAQTRLTDAGLATGRSLKLGEVFKYPLISKNTDVIVGLETVGDACEHRNFYWATMSPVARLAPARLEKGIWPIASVPGSDGLVRKPAVLVRISSHKAGSAETPWHDDVDQIAGDATYYGDKRPDDKFKRPDESPGNRVLLEQQALHHSPRRDDRLRAAPPSSSRALRRKARPRVTSASTGSAYCGGCRGLSDRREGRYFSNYRFDCSLISLAAEGERLPWDWISARRAKGHSAEDAVASAPLAWREWVDDGMESIPRVRRRVALATTLSEADQLPDARINR